MELVLLSHGVLRALKADTGRNRVGIVVAVVILLPLHIRSTAFGEGQIRSR